MLKSLMAQDLRGCELIKTFKVDAGNVMGVRISDTIGLIRA